MKLMILLCVFAFAFSANAKRSQPSGTRAAWVCGHGNIRATIDVQVMSSSSDGTYVEAPAVAEVKVVSLSPSRTLVSETRPADFTRFVGGSAHVKANGLFVGRFFENPNVIYDKKGRLVFRGSESSCVEVRR